jgi:uncharacterized protein (DUF1501 family)
MSFTITRRRFLAASAVTGSATLIPGTNLVFATPENPLEGDALVVVFLYGGADGLSVMGPFNEPGYRELRPNIRLLAPGEGVALGRTGADALPLVAGGDRFFAPGFDGFFGLHPQMRALYDGLWAQNRLALIPACGLPDYESGTRSHFEATEHWERGTANRSLLTGFLGRYLASAGATGTLPGVNADNQATTMLRGPVRRLSIGDLGNFGIQGFSTQRGTTTSVLRSLYAGRTQYFEQQVNDLLPAVGTIQDINPDAPANLPRNGAVYPNTTFARRMRHLAVLLRNPVGLKVAQVGLGGWDHHSGMRTPEDPEGNTHRRITELSNTLAAFAQDLGDALNEVSIVVLTEFGRTAHENGSNGTDHGRGALVMAIGGGIRGGVYGNFPDRVGIPDRFTVPVLTDYRLILAEIMQNRSGNQNVGQVFPTMRPGNYLGVTRP